MHINDIFCNLNSEGLSNVEKNKRCRLLILTIKGFGLLILTIKNQYMSLWQGFNKNVREHG